MKPRKGFTTVTGNKNWGWASVKQKVPVDRRIRLEDTKVPGNWEIEQTEISDPDALIS